VIKPCRGKIPDGWEYVPGIPGWIRPAPPAEPVLPEKGDKGDAGPQGEPGPKGDKGDRGEPGEQGKPGPAGRDGKDGKDGKPGKDGNPGKDGAPGRDGADGQDGTGIEDIKSHGQDMLIKLTDGREQRFRLPGGGSSSFGGSSASSSGGIEDAPSDGNYYLRKDGEWVQSEDTVVYAINYDDVGGGVAYVGEALPGSTAASAVWRIKRLVFVGDDVTVTWADGVATFTKVWDNRTLYVY